ncbi:hypothetical protein C8R43DRAFT_1113300 [Mycena crocata]|nr:hypothetical protein C8R43DRAFT_1113300 [Mycena crocata]
MVPVSMFFLYVLGSLIMLLSVVVDLDSLNSEQMAVNYSANKEQLDPNTEDAEQWGRVRDSQVLQHPPRRLGAPANSHRRQDEHTANGSIRTALPFNRDLDLVAFQLRAGGWELKRTGCDKKGLVAGGPHLHYIMRKICGTIYGCGVSVGRSFSPIFSDREGIRPLPTSKLLAAQYIEQALVAGDFFNKDDIIWRVTFLACQSGLRLRGMACIGLGLGFGCDAKPKPGYLACKPFRRLGKPFRRLVVTQKIWAQNGKSKAQATQKTRKPSGLFSCTLSSDHVLYPHHKRGIIFRLPVFRQRFLKVIRQTSAAISVILEDQTRITRKQPKLKRKRATEGVGNPAKKLNTVSGTGSKSKRTKCTTRSHTAAAFPEGCKRRAGRLHPNGHASCSTSASRLNTLTACGRCSLAVRSVRAAFAQLVMTQ